MEPKIKEIRKSRGITQKHIADSLGVKQETVRKWEKGLSFPDMKQAHDLAALLFVGVEELYKEEKHND